MPDGRARDRSCVVASCHQRPRRVPRHTSSTLFLSIFLSIKFLCSVPTLGGRSAFGMCAPICHNEAITLTHVLGKTGLPSATGSKVCGQPRVLIPQPGECGPRQAAGYGFTVFHLGRWRLVHLRGVHKEGLGCMLILLQWTQKGTSWIPPFGRWSCPGLASASDRFLSAGPVLLEGSLCPLLKSGLQRIGHFGSTRMASAPSQFSA